MEKQLHTLKSMSRKELADKYGISTKTLGKRLARRGLQFEGDRTLLPIQVKQIIDVLGHWDIVYTDDP